MNDYSSYVCRSQEWDVMVYIGVRLSGFEDDVQWIEVIEDWFAGWERGCHWAWSRDLDSQADDDVFVWRGLIGGENEDRGKSKMQKQEIEKTDGLEWNRWIDDGRERERSRKQDRVEEDESGESELRQKEQIWRRVGVGFGFRGTWTGSSSRDQLTGDFDVRSEVVEGRGGLSEVFIHSDEVKRKWGDCWWYSWYYSRMPRQKIQSNEIHSFASACQTIHSINFSLSLSQSSRKPAVCDGMRMDKSWWYDVDGLETYEMISTDQVTSNLCGAISYRLLQSLFFQSQSQYSTSYLTDLRKQANQGKAR